MKVTVGPPHIIIAQALELGILCRPVYHNIGPGQTIRVGHGEALEVSPDCFWITDGSSPGCSEPFSPSPAELTLDWVLITREIIEKEWEDDEKSPF